MDEKDIFANLTESCLNFDPEAARKYAKEAIEAGVDPIEAIEKGLAPGIRRLGEKFENGEVFLPELIMGGVAMQDAMKILESKIPQGKERKILGRVLLGTVRGDIHDIGKNIVASLLKANGFEVHDVGVDVPTEVFVQKVRELEPDVVGLSALLTTTLPAQKEVVAALEQAGLRKRVKVIVGGAAASRDWCVEAGADGYAGDAVGATKLAKEVLGK